MKKYEQIREFYLYLLTPTLDETLSSVFFSFGNFKGGFAKSMMICGGLVFLNKDELHGTNVMFYRLNRRYIDSAKNQKDICFDL